MADFRGIGPMPMTGNLAENWKIWRRRFENYLVASEVKKKDQATQVAQLLHYIGEEGFIIFNTFTFSEGDDKKLETVIRKFEEHFLPKKNLSYERFKFFTRKQQMCETIEQFITDLKNKALSCEFGDLKDSLVKDIFTCGLTDITLREKLLQEDSLNLDSAVKMCVTVEKSREQSSNMCVSASSVPVETIHKNRRGVIAARPSPVQQNRYRRHFQPNRSVEAAQTQMVRHAATNATNATMTAGSSRGGRTSQQRVQGRNFSCFRCGGAPHIKNNCPAIGKVCLHCGIPNHFASVCRNKKVHCVNENNDSQNDDYLFIDSIEINSIDHNSWNVTY